MRMRIRIVIASLSIWLAGCSAIVGPTNQVDRHKAQADAASLLGFSSLKQQVLTPSESDRPNRPENDQRPPNEPNQPVRPDKKPIEPKPKKTDYQMALENHSRSGKPLLVFLTADWCRYCNMVKRDLPRYKKKGLFDSVEFVVVDYDKERRLAERFLSDANIKGVLLPTTVMYWKANGDTRFASHKGYITEQGFRSLIQKAK